MPTVLPDIDGFDVIINTRNEHGPPHVHVWRAGNEAIIYLGDENTPPLIHEVNGNMSNKDVRRAWDIVNANQELLIKNWGEIWEARYGKVED